MIVICPAAKIVPPRIYYLDLQTEPGHWKMYPSVALLALFWSFILYPQSLQTAVFGRSPFSKAHSKVVLKVRVTLTISRSWEKQYSIKSLLLMLARFVKLTRPLQIRWCSYIFLISLCFADYEQSYYDYYKDDSDYFETYSGSEGTFDYIRVIRFQFQYVPAKNLERTGCFLFL